MEDRKTGFRLYTLDQLLNEVGPESAESAYRRGYRAGFVAATNNLYDLQHGGYQRMLEVYSILYSHWQTDLFEWEQRSRQEKFCPPPMVLVKRWWELRKQVFERDGYRCFYCGNGKQDGCKLVVDHVRPVKSGGIAKLTNLVTACSSCNLKKGTMDILEFDSGAYYRWKGMIDDGAV